MLYLDVDSVGEMVLTNNDVTALGWLCFISRPDLTNFIKAKNKG